MNSLTLILRRLNLVLLGFLAINLVLILNGILLFGQANRYLNLAALLSCCIAVFLKRRTLWHEVQACTNVLLTAVTILSIVPPLYIATFSFYRNHLFPVGNYAINLNEDFHLIFEAKGMLGCGDRVVLYNKGIVQRRYATAEALCYQQSNLTTITPTDSIVWLNFEQRGHTFRLGVDLQSNCLIEEAT